MISRAPANASPRCGADTATDHARLATAAPSPTRCSAAAAHSPWRSTASRDDRRDPLLGHLGVGLVLEPLDLARHALEGRPPRRRAGRARARRSASSDSGSVGHPRVHGAAASPPLTGGISASSSPGVEHARRSSRVLAVHRHHERQPVGEVAQRVERVAHPRALGQLERELARARALAQQREEADGDLHASGMLRPPWTSPLATQAPRRARAAAGSGGRAARPRGGRAPARGRAGRSATSAACGR